MSVRIRIHADGKCTVSGLQYDTVRSFITQASLYQYDHPYKSKPHDSEVEEHLPGIQARNDRYGKEWHRKMRWGVDSLSAAMDKAISDSHPLRAPLTLKQRLLLSAQRRKDWERIVKELGLD